MAGSYNHVVDSETGRLLDAEGINGMLECHSGDVVECVEEMYGMIWWLAEQVRQSPDQHFRGFSAADYVEDARQNYREGLEISPGTGFHLPPED